MRKKEKKGISYSFAKPKLKLREKIKREEFL